jgi:hypothetical protein
MYRENDLQVLTVLVAVHRADVAAPSGSRFDRSRFIKYSRLSRRREELVVDTHDACVRSRVSEFASSCARTSS